MDGIASGLANLVRRYTDPGCFLTGLPPLRVRGHGTVVLVQLPVSVGTCVHLTGEFRQVRRPDGRLGRVGGSPQAAVLQAAGIQWVRGRLDQEPGATRRADPLPPKGVQWRSDCSHVGIDPPRHPTRQLDRLEQLGKDEAGRFAGTATRGAQVRRDVTEQPDVEADTVRYGASAASPIRRVFDHMFAVRSSRHDMAFT